jgi:hypothetical protein
VVPFLANLYKYLVKVPAPKQAIGPHSANPEIPDFGGTHRSKTMPPAPDNLMAHVGPAVMK